MLPLKLKLYSILFSLLGHITLIAAALYFCSFFTKSKTEQKQIYMVSLVPLLSDTRVPLSGQDLSKKISTPLTQASSLPATKRMDPQLPPEALAEKNVMIKKDALTSNKTKKAKEKVRLFSEPERSLDSTIQAKVSNNFATSDNNNSSKELGQFGSIPVGGSYDHLVISHLINAKRYPERARRRGVEGAVVLGFEINRDGSVSNRKLSKSCSSGLLNEAALAMVTRAAPFPAPPNDYRPGQTLEFQVPIRFALY